MRPLTDTRPLHQLRVFFCFRLAVFCSVPGKTWLPRETKRADSDQTLPRLVQGPKCRSRREETRTKSSWPKNALIGVLTSALQIREDLRVRMKREPDQS